MVGAAPGVPSKRTVADTSSARSGLSAIGVILIALLLSVTSEAADVSVMTVSVRFGVTRSWMLLIW